jgi:hypothetical protein
MSTSAPSILATAVGVIRSAFDEHRIKFDAETAIDVVFALDSITSPRHDVPDDLTGHIRPNNVTTFLGTPLQPWTGPEDDVEGQLTWALQIIVLELSEDTDNINFRLDGGRLTRTGSAHQALSKLLSER